MGKHCCHSPLNEKSAKEMLGNSGLNRTKTKVRLLLELSRSDRPLSVYDLHDKLKQSCDVSTIFRTIAQFKEKLIVQEVNLDEGFFRYEMAADPSDDEKQNDHHHHHIRCRKCGDIRQIEKCDLSAFEKAIAKLGFKDMEHRLEFTGLCSQCA
jgi:Fur family ferric uptake transcriptional regulator